MTRPLLLLCALAALCGCQGPEAGPVTASQIVTNHKLDPEEAKKGIDQQIAKIRNSNLSPEEKTKALAVFGATP